MPQEVAVKVQRPDIRRHANWDLWAYRALLRLYGEGSLMSVRSVFTIVDILPGYFFDLPLAFAADYISDQLMVSSMRYLRILRM
jgi:aarF domain-containing kinase